MKSRIIILVALVVFLAHEGFSQQPKLKFDNLVHDFGNIKETDGRIQHSFKFTNTSKDTLKISRVSSNSQTTNAEWSSKSIPPNGSGYVKINYSPKDQEGAFRIPINLSTNEVDFQQQNLFIKGTVIARHKTFVDRYPKNIGNLRFDKTHLAIDNLKKDESRTESFKVYNEWSKPMTLRIENVPDHMTISIIPETLLPGQDGMIKVFFDASKCPTWGLSYNFYKLLTNDTLTPSKNITVGVNVVEDFSKLTPQERENAPKINFEKKTHNFGTIKEGSLAEYNFQFTNTGKSDLIIRRTKAACGCTSAKMQKTVLKPGETGSVNIVFNSRGYHGKKRKSISVICNDPEKSVTMLFIEMTMEDK